MTSASTATSLLVKVLVPADQAASAAAGRRSAQYFSPATQSVVITAVGPSPSAAATTAYVNVNTANPACTGYASTTCDVNLGLTASGTYTLTFSAYDAAQSKGAPPFAGRLLATNATSLQFVAGTT